MEVIRDNKTFTLSTNLEKVLDDNLTTIKQLIVDKAADLAFEGRPYIEEASAKKSVPSKQLLDFNDLAKAINLYAPGWMVNVIIEKKKWYEIFFSYFPPFTIVCIVLTFTFGAFGIHALANNPVSGPGGGFLDIAKIFAGAIVGSTSSKAITSLSKKKRNS